MTKPHFPFSRFAVAALLGAALSLLTGHSHASSTLEKIAETGTIAIGYDVSSPFSFTDGKSSQPVGYTIDICMKVVEAIKRELRQPGLTVNFVQVPTAERIAALKAGKYDLECGSAPNTAEAREEVAFTIPTYIAGARILKAKGTPIEKLLDINGKTVVTTEGTNSERLIRDKKYQLSLQTRLVLGKGHGESFSILESGKADAFVMDDIVLSALLAESKAADRFSMSKDLLTIEPLAIMMRKDDTSFKQLVDTEITRVIIKGEISRIYRKWFESPIPPNQVNLKLPMNYLLWDFFRNPTDFVPG
jgi:glutamate/aspartate transport system substrate-binding protein